MNLTRSGAALQVLLLPLLLWIACDTAEVSKEEWEAFKAKYGKQYIGQNETRHFGIFNRRVQEMQQHNRLYAAGNASFEMGLNEYSDIEQNLLPFLAEEPPDPHQGYSAIFDIPMSPDYKTYDQISGGRDWRNDGCISPVGSQGECLACWAFAASAAVEAHLALKNKRLVELSAQHLLDCSRTLNMGCEGGWASEAYKYIMRQGIATSASYPYKAKTETCRYDPSTSAGRARYYVTLNDDERELAEVVYNIGPVTVSIDHMHSAFENYKQGVLTIPECRSDRRSLRHSMLLVGFGTDPKWGDYWLIKNSYGTTWGIDGYLKLARNAGNMCGVASIAQYPLV